MQRENYPRKVLAEVSGTKRDSMAVFSKIKQALVNSPTFVSIVSFLTRKRTRIFIYHRFCKQMDWANRKLDADTFEWQMQELKGWNVMTLGEYLQLMSLAQKLPPYIVILTMDDGYKDFYDIAYPILKRNGLKATLFPTVNFVEGGWLWWDRLTYVLQQTHNKEYVFIFNSKSFNLRMTTKEEVLTSWELLSNYCIKIKTDDKWNLIIKLENELNVDVPLIPPDELSSVTWQQLKEMSENGIEIGSHTLTHSILSRIQNMALLDKEINEAKVKIELKINKPVFSFCYPNGKKEDINKSIVRQIKKAGYKGAVTTIPYGDGYFDPYMLPRMGAGTDKTDFLWKLYGMGHIINKIIEYANKF